MQTGFMKRVVLVAAATAALLLAGTAQAALQDRDLDGNGQTDAFFDTDLNITWLRDANVNRLMNWDAANTWASALVVNGVGGWRLPSSNTCFGYNCTGSEMGHLWYTELGNLAPGPMTSTGDFQNLQFNAAYWSGTLHNGPSSGERYSFTMVDGWTLLNGGGPTNVALFAMAVRDGDVPAIPEPGTYALMLAGLAALTMAKRRRRN